MITAVLIGESKKAFARGLTCKRDQAKDGLRKNASIEEVERNI